MRNYILSIPLEAGRGISAETCGLDDVFPPDDLGSGPYDPFTIYIQYNYSCILRNLKKMLLPRYIHTKSWCYHAGVLDDIILLQNRDNVTLCIGKLHNSIVCRTGLRVWVVLVLSIIMCSFYYFLDRILFHHDFLHVKCDYYRDLGPFFTFWTTLLGFLQLCISDSANAHYLDVPASGHPPWILDGTCYLQTLLYHVYIPYYDILQGSSGLCNWLSFRRSVWWINHSLARMLVHFLNILDFSFIVTNVKASQDFRLSYFQVSKSAFVSTYHVSTLILHSRSLETFFKTFLWEVILIIPNFDR